MPGILAFDQATVTGWAHAEPGESPTFGHQRMGKTGATSGQVGAAFHIFLQARLDLFRPNYVCFESPWVPRPRRPRFVKAGTPVPPDTSVPMNALTLRRLMALPMMIETVCEQWGIECREAPPQEISAFFLGAGSLKSEEKKRRTIEMCRAYGWQATEDEADALALLVYAEAKLFPEFRMKRPIVAGPLFSKLARPGAVPAP